MLLGIREGKCLVSALQEEPWLISEWLKNREAASVELRIVVDADSQLSKAFFIRDLPISFKQEHRKYGFHGVTEMPVQRMLNPASRKFLAGTPTQHDPMLELRGE